MDNVKEQMLHVIKNVYEKLKANNYYSQEEILKWILDTKFCEFKRITFHGTIDIVINLEIKYCKDEAKLNDTKKLKTDMKSLDALIKQFQKRECLNIQLAKKSYLENLGNLFRNVSHMDIETMRHEYLRSTNIYQSQETNCINNITQLELKSVIEKKDKLREFLRTHESIYWAAFGCTDFLKESEHFKTINDFLEKFTIEEENDGFC